MEQRLSIITLGVENLAKTAAFYDALGWKRASKEEGIIAYNLQNMTLALFPLEELAKDVTASVSRGSYSTVTLAYNVRSEEEVDSTLQEAKKIGAEIIKPAEKVFWGGYSGYFADPDGQLWEVAFNPFSELGPNGEFQWTCD